MAARHPIARGIAVLCTVIVLVFLATFALTYGTDGRLSSALALAGRVGRPRAARAVGGALNRNPIAIVVPCHRVVGSTGSLVGYAGGIDKKLALLRLEGAIDTIC